MIYIVRHGQTDWNVAGRIQGLTDIPLNDVGRGQARETAKLVAKHKFDRIISSDLSRARETAEIIGKHISIEVEIDPRIREFNMGDMQGRIGKEIPEADWTLFRKDRRKYNAETLQEIYTRVRNFLENIKNSNNILVVTHSGTLKMMFFCARHDEFDENKFAEYFHATKFENACLVEWK